MIGSGRKKLFAKKIFFLCLLFPLFLLSPAIYSQNHDLSVRVELLYPEGIEEIELDSILSVKVCFDFLREEKNYLKPFSYQLALRCNGKKVAKENLTYEPPKGIAIKRTTICKTFKLDLKEFIKPPSPLISLKGWVKVKEADGTRMKGRSEKVETKVKTEYEELRATGTIQCPSHFPLSLVKIEIFGMEKGIQRIAQGFHAITFSDRWGFFSATFPSLPHKNLQMIAHLYCPEEESPSLTISSNVSENTSSFGTIILPCLPCSGPIAAGEMEQMLPPRSPASVASRFEFIKR